MNCGRDMINCICKYRKKYVGGIYRFCHKQPWECKCTKDEVM